MQRKREWFDWVKNALQFIEQRKKTRTYFNRLISSKKTKFANTLESAWPARCKELSDRWERFFILAGGHVRASAGDLAVHGALIPCVCVCVCVCVCLCVCPVSNSFLITSRIGTKFVSVNR